MKFYKIKIFKSQELELKNKFKKTHDLEVVRTVVNIGSFVIQSLIFMHLIGVL